jgi:hypothetical protein
MKKLLALICSVALCALLANALVNTIAPLAKVEKALKVK